jgi:hypothetical protein
MGNTQLPRFNAKWLDPKCEDIDSLRLPDAAWQREAYYCNPLGTYYLAYVRSYTNWAQQLSSSHPMAPTSRGSNSYTACPPKPSTTPPHMTFSSPDGKARARGSDDQDGA